MPNCKAPAGAAGAVVQSQDYPESLSGLFAVSWDFPNVEPPNYLRQLVPASTKPKPAGRRPVR